ncbi:MAG TPA: hypothetical protein VGN16_07920 [Acidobacteriaceae bacterium]|jgi:hypothetical protein
MTAVGVSFQQAARPGNSQARILRHIRIWLVIFIVGLALSGITAFPLQSETALLVRTSSALGLTERLPALHAWFVHVADALAETNARYPFLAYGTDWLAFAHLVIAVAFIGPYRDPVRNKWIFDFGLIACAGVIPLALIAGPIRGIPIYWRIIDCSFGVFGCLPLLLCRKLVHRLEVLQQV